MSSEGFEGLESEKVLFIEVGGDDDDSLGRKSFKGLIIEGGPKTRAIPEILVPKEGEMSGAGNFAKKIEMGSIAGDKFCLELGWSRLFVRPTGGGFIELSRSDIDSGEANIIARVCEKVC